MTQVAANGPERRQEMLDEETTHPGPAAWDGARFHQAAQNGLQSKTYDLLFLEFSI